MNLIWATCGRMWGFRFLLDGGYADPLPVYERAFSGLEDEQALCHRVGESVVLRLEDPLGRRDAAGRLIPHDFVMLSPTLGLVDSVDDGLRTIWPTVSDVYAQVWEDPAPPTAERIRAVFQERSTG
ncbi:hypothetical protein [Acidipropionibacterium acidipropionici]|uniref:hypothetical protein n=1 Tax=Acidipropionibacterium acidipropionici TaxID=1748 RepID=UPI0006863D86|nr:hypothetical protein [Acidipropionibacterium acidipropionici]ALN16434.1 hypothetical protein ASQ49_15430 [Acidipropionibacterium acidipropionici]APZ10510.1 hypothetical protein BWX38_16075 [Acidipropionibacterium acidipropionici]